MKINKKLMLTLSIILGAVAFICFENDAAFSWSGIFFMFTLASFWENRVARKKIKEEDDSLISLGYCTLRPFFKNDMEKYLSFTADMIAVSFLVGCVLFLKASITSLLSLLK